MLYDEKEKLQNFIRQLIVFREDLHDLEKTFSRLRNESEELYLKLEKKLNEY